MHPCWTCSGLRSALIETNIIRYNVYFEGPPAINSNLAIRRGVESYIASVSDDWTSIVIERIEASDLFFSLARRGTKKEWLIIAHKAFFLSFASTSDVFQEESQSLFCTEREGTESVSSGILQSTLWCAQRKRERKATMARFYHLTHLKQNEPMKQGVQSTDGRETWHTSFLSFPL